MHILIKVDQVKHLIQTRNIQLFVAQMMFHVNLNEIVQKNNIGIHNNLH